MHCLLRCSFNGICLKGTIIMFVIIVLRNRYIVSRDNVYFDDLGGNYVSPSPNKKQCEHSRLFQFSEIQK